MPGSIQSSIGLGLLLGAIVTGACTGDAPVLGDTPPPTNDDAGGLPPQPPADSGTPDATLTCAKDLGDCDANPSNGCETNLLSPDNCGACGHACGGTATCLQGQCTPEPLSSTLDHPFGLALAGQRALWLSPSAVFGCTTASCSASTAIMVDVETTSNNPVPGASFSPRQIAVDGTTFYYEKCPPGSPNSDCSPAACPITGCKSGGPINGSTMLKTSSGYRRASILVGGPGAVYTFYGLDGLQKFSIPVPSTNSYPGFGVIDYFGAAFVDAAHFVYIDDDPSVANPNGGLFVCPAAGCNGGRGPTLLAPPLRLLTVGGGIAVTTSGGAANLPNATVFACAITGCDGGGAVLAQNQAYISDIVADDKDVFWATVGAPNPTTNTATVGTIMRCSLPSCDGGPQKIADQVVNPVGIQVDANYVYWITYGTGSNKNGTLVRRRR